MALPILIAKDRNAKICVDDYKIGWYQKDENNDDWIWIVYGSCKDLESAIKCANDIVREKGDRPIYISEKSLIKESKVQTEKLELKQIN